MSTELDQFEESIRRVEALRALHDVLINQTTSIIDLTDLLRACYVLALSAFDSYVHEAARRGMMQIFDGLRPSTDAYGRFKLSMQSITGAPTFSDACDNLEADIRIQHSFLAFQKPDKVSDAIRLISDATIWEEIGKTLGRPTKEIKDQLNLIVDRRNKIAHEADLDPTYPNTRWPINPADVKVVVTFITTIVHGLDAIIAL